MMVAFPIAKLNLGLRITEKRADGYHNIETIFYPFGLCDALEFVIADKQGDKDFITITGIDTGIDPEENLVIKAVKKLHGRYSFPYLNIHLHKVIPIGAGLGGGSSDSASILKTINRYFGLHITDSELKSISLELGSDCPFFIDSIPAFASGRGEILKSAPPVLSGLYLVMFNPGVMISTQDAYKNCRPGQPAESLLQLITLPFNKWKELIINDFEDFALKRHPVIGEIKEELYNNGALFSLMTGSGSSVYGIFREKPILPDNLKKYLIYECKL
jgi:4-diphosphocytidyl-2-C-methyl-D-erythritol kinase